MKDYEKYLLAGIIILLIGLFSYPLVGSNYVPLGAMVLGISSISYGVFFLEGSFEVEE